MTGESPFDLGGRNALVTGAARGLGRAIALGLAGQGANVALVDMRGDELETTAAEVRSRGPRAFSRICDVADSRAVEETVAAVVDELGSIDILVNNAGITKRIPLFDWQEDDWNEVIRINQVGTFLMARAVGRGMIAQRKGSIVNIAALGGGVVGLGRGNAIYCSTKGAVVALTRDLAAEWSRYGVRVNCVAPGWFRTEMNAALLKDQGLVDRILERVPLGKLGEPDDVVGPVVFLASDAAAMVTAQVLVIDGGVSGIVSLGHEDRTG